MPARQAARAAAAATASRWPVAERRLVSVLFADLVGFTTLAEGRDPEETRELLTRYFDIAREVIERHGGTVEKFIGDAVMAVWGAPTAHEDDAERAVRAALAIWSRSCPISARAQPLQARAGVLTGEAAVTVGADGPGHRGRRHGQHRQPAAVGGAPGTVLVGEATDRAAGERHRLRGGRRAGAQGQGRAGPAWRAITRGRASAADRAARARSSRRSWAATTSCASSRSCSTPPAASRSRGWSRSSARPASASAGSPGSSRSTSTAWSSTAYWHEGRSPSYGEGISFWALAEMVRRRAGIAEGDDADDRPAEAWPRRSRIRARRRGATLDRAAARRPAGLEELPADGREELFAAWRTFFERIAARRRW